MSDTNSRNVQRRHNRIALTCVVFVFCMVGAAFASVPLYDMFCRVTGYGGTPQIAADHAGRALERTVRVRFDSNVAPGLNWEFVPLQREMTVRIGETHLAFYRAKNRGREASTGMATYNVSPLQTGGYFNKMHCFCFEQQELAAGEEMEMPVQFYVDPAMVDDHELDGVGTITLSYTFYSAKPDAVAQTRAQPKL